MDVAKGESETALPADKRSEPTEVPAGRTVHATTDELAEQFSQLAKLTPDERRATLAKLPDERKLLLSEYNKKVTPGAVFPVFGRLQRPRVGTSDQPNVRVLRKGGRRPASHAHAHKHKASNRLLVHSSRAGWPTLI